MILRTRCKARIPARSLLFGINNSFRYRCVIVEVARADKPHCPTLHAIRFVVNGKLSFQWTNLTLCDVPSHIACTVTNVRI